MSEFEKYGHSISDNEGELRDISGIIKELKEIYHDFSTHGMSDYVLYRQGQRLMLDKVIKYLERV